MQLALSIRSSDAELTMSEETLSNEERNAILRQVLAPPVPKECVTPKKSSNISEAKTDLSQASFGDLLEQTLDIRSEMDKEDLSEAKKIDEARDVAISNSRFDILKDWHL
jgi:hypothetical protein